MRSTLFGILVALHVLLGGLGLVYGVHQLGEKAQDAANKRAEAAKDRALTEAQRAEADRLQALLDGKRKLDPYVVELLARDRLRYLRPGELSPPPAPASDRMGGNPLQRSAQP
jgi:hypothetical protein